MAKGTAEQRHTEDEPQGYSAMYTAFKKRVEDSMYDHLRSSDHEQDRHAGSTALLMQTRTRQAPAVQRHYEEQFASRERRDSPYQQQDVRNSPHHSSSLQLPPEQQRTPPDFQQRDDEYAIKQYQRLLLREQAKRNREMGLQ